jgi:hypothetical protein
MHRFQCTKSVVACMLLYIAHCALYAVVRCMLLYVVCCCMLHAVRCLLHAGCCLCALTWPRRGGLLGVLHIAGGEFGDREEEEHSRYHLRFVLSVLWALCIQCVTSVGTVRTVERRLWVVPTDKSSALATKVGVWNAPKPYPCEPTSYSHPPTHSGTV